MKLLRYGPVGEEQPGLLDEHGTIRSLTGILPDLTGGTSRRQALNASLRSIPPHCLPSADSRAWECRSPGPASFLPLA